MCFAEIYTMITGTCISPEDKIITDDRYLKQTLFRIHYFCKNTQWKLLRSIKLRLPLGQNFWCVLYTQSAFFQNFGGPKWGVRIIHHCVLYSPKYGIHFDISSTTDARINRKLTSDSYRNESHHMACQNKECAKMSSLRDE